MATWVSVIILIFLFFFVEISIYISFLLIKALRIYIKKNNNLNSVETTKGVDRKFKTRAIGIAVFNVILVAF